MISQFSATGFRCLKNVTIQLTPLHALIGPNDSGKSTILEGLNILLKPGQQFAVPGPAFRVEDGIRISDNTHGGQLDGVVDLGSLHATKGADALQIDRDVFDIRFDPDAMRAPCKLLQPNNPVSFFDSRGRGLAAVYHSMLTRGDETFLEARDRIRTLFPTVKRVGTPAHDEATIEFEVELTDGTLLRANALSEGLLYYLGFECLNILSTPGTLLVEEPENGLHPARIREVVGMLRRMTERGVQIIMATHHPLVINELRPEEVTVVTRPSVETGSIARNMARDVPNVTRWLESYSLGELWLAFADGKLEEELNPGAVGTGSRGSKSSDSKLVNPMRH